jgi:predicted glycosyltransferase involved in capsule biosynthesis
MDYSYVIGHRGTNSYRVDNLIKTIDWVSQFPVNIVIVEQDDCPKIEDVLRNKKVKYIFAKNKSLYNRSWAFNVAHRIQKYDYMICADNDMMLSTDSFNKFLNACNNYDAVSPFKNLYDLTEDESRSFNPDTFKLDDRGARGWMNFTSGICGISRKAMENVGGWDERFEGWGGEDDAMTKQILDNTPKNIQLDNNCFHFFHPRSISDGAAHHEKYGSNLSILEEHKSGMYKLKDISNKGSLDKYSNQ